MKVSISWLKELVDLKISIEELIRLLPFRTIGIKEATDRFIELDMKGYNRADLLSMRGVAQEVTAITNSPLCFDTVDTKSTIDEVNLPEVNAQIENPEFAPVYCAAKIEELRVGPSSEDWIEKLEDSGIRAVNNIADVTNLIMLEYGQPMHAFDAAKVKNETIIVRLAKKNEEIVTLDGKKRVLDETDLLIADPQKALGLAGVMGGKNSEVTETTTTILLEAAIFDPVSNRQSSKRHGLNSEATKRFQHGLTKTNLLQAFSSTIKMYAGLGGKLTAITLVGNLDDKPKTIKLTQEKINSLIGIDIPANQVESSLTALGFKLASHMESGKVIWDVTVPYFRLDMEIEEDVIEEVARMYGYEKIPSKELTGELPERLNQDFHNAIYDLKKALVEIGLTEVQTYSFYSSKTINDLRLTINDLIKIANPISSETKYLRDNLWPNLLEVVAKNLRQGYKDIAIFEIGKVYLPLSKGLPKEIYRLSIALSNGTDNPIQELYQIAQNLPLLRSHLNQGRTLTQRAYFHPTRQTDWIAEIHPRFVNKFGIEQRVAVLEIEI